MQSSKKKIIITVYSHPEFYPPTLNLIKELSKKFDQVVVLSRNVFESNWLYPENTIIHVSGRKTTIRESEKASTFKKVISFTVYTWSLLKLIIGSKPEMLVLCDPIPTLSYKIIKPFISRRLKIWYHNHDVLDQDKARKFSISWFSIYSEKSIFKDLKIFTLPSEARKKYFPIESLKGKYYFLPNYPSTEFFSRFQLANLAQDDAFRIIFQGEISEGHGFEQIVEILQKRINNKDIELLLVGRVSAEYRQKLELISKEFNVERKLIFKQFIPYIELPLTTRSCHLGIAIYTKNDIMNNTISTASNKIYEYAALGLPVILFDNQQFRNQLNHYPWCIFTDLTQQSLREAITKVISDFGELTISAKAAQVNKLNFENYFVKIEL